MRATPVRIMIRPDEEVEMPLVNVRVMEGVLSDSQKGQIADEITDTLVRVIGEEIRGVTFVVVDDIASGQLSIGGDRITTDAVKQMLGRTRAAAR
jgi:4-oxalocrotonate tautomerase